MREMDLYRRILPVNEFLVLILNVSLNSNRHEIGIILQDNILREELDAYMRPMKMGQKQYQHLIRMLNKIISVASQFHHCNDLGIKFTRSGPTFILGTATSGNLDTAGGELVIDGQSHQVEAITEKGPTNAPPLADISTFVWFQPRHPPSDAVLDSYVAPSEPVSQAQLSSREVKAMPEGRELLKKTVIVKLSNPAKSRLSEIETVAKACRRAASSDNARRFLKNLPPIIDHEDRAAGRVQMALFGHFKDLYELRVPRAIIMEQLFPITELADAASAAPVYRDIVDCYRWLFDVCEIRHSDISINNLMYRKDEDGIGIHGVLNDFDLAQCGDFTGPQSRQRTGTEQFMAYDLLDPHESHPHFYRHDLESIFYVMVFHLCGYDQGKEITFGLQDWPELASNALWDKKTAFFSREVPSTTKHFAPLAIWLHKLADIFHQGFTARTRNQRLTKIGESKPFKKETLDDHVTFDVFKRIISADNGI